MRYLPNTPAQQKEMLRAIGASSIEDLLAPIPSKARLSRPLNLSAALSETDLIRHMRALAALNADADQYACFLGGGVYDHYIPSPINHLISRGEFFTAYTPYQPEASQGTLRTIYEYQTMIAELTGMDVANASIYDGASSLAEAALMACRLTRRHRVAVSTAVNPQVRRVLATYCSGPGIEVVEVPADLAVGGSGLTPVEAAARFLDDGFGCLVAQQPNFFGGIEPMGELADASHAVGAQFVAVVEPTSLALLAAPLAAGAQQTGKVARIGMLLPGDAPPP